MALNSQSNLLTQLILPPLNQAKKLYLTTNFYQKLNFGRTHFSSSWLGMTRLSSENIANIMHCRRYVPDPSDWEIPKELVIKAKNW